MREAEGKKKGSEKGKRMEMRNEEERRVETKADRRKI